jgi:hypothetical protein
MLAAKEPGGLRPGLATVTDEAPADAPCEASDSDSRAAREQDAGKDPYPTLFAPRRAGC